jgi:hypothetical protein
VNVAIERGFARKALEGVALMARAVARRRRNLRSVSVVEEKQLGGGSIHGGDGSWQWWCKF